MYRGKKILALITARGGSKGIPRKNIKLLGGKSLICWSIDAAQKSKTIDRLILSSEDAEIISIAEKANCEVPFVRPLQLAQDESSSMDVIMHALMQVTEDFDYLLLLQPTSPFRSGKDIDGIVQACLDQKSEMMISVAKLKKHPMFMYEMEGGFLKSFVDVTEQLRRQDMPAAYEHNGSLYIAHIDFLKKVQSYTVPEARPYEMYGVSNLDIDDLADWQYAEFLLAKGEIL